MPEQNNDTYERRSMQAEVRAAQDANGKPIITGLSPVYNQRSDVLIERGVKFIEIIMPGALDKVLGVADVRGRYNHRTVMGRTKNGTLELTNTPEGLRYTIHVNDNDPEAMSIYQRVSRGDVDGSSFAFNVPPDGDIITTENGMRIRYVREISNLLDVGPVDFPAYPQSVTTAAVRSKLETLQHEEQAPTDQAESSGSEDSVKVRQAARRRTLELLDA